MSQLLGQGPDRAQRGQGPERVFSNIEKWPVIVPLKTLLGKSYLVNPKAAFTLCITLLIFYLFSGVLQVLQAPCAPKHIAH